MGNKQINTEKKEGRRKQPETVDHMVEVIEFAKHMVSLMERTHGKRHVHTHEKGPSRLKKTHDRARQDLGRKYK